MQLAKIDILWKQRYLHRYHKCCQIDPKDQPLAAEFQPRKPICRRSRQADRSNQRNSCYNQTVPVIIREITLQPHGRIIGPVHHLWYDTNRKFHDVDLIFKGGRHHPDKGEHTDHSKQRDDQSSSDSKYQSSCICFHIIFPPKSYTFLSALPALRRLLQ